MLKKLSYIFSYVAAGLYIASGTIMLVCGILYLIIAGQTVHTDPQMSSYYKIFGITYIVLIVIFIPLAWFCFYYANRVKNAYSKAEIQTISIIALFLAGLLPGLFAILSEDADYPAFKNKVKNNSVEYIDKVYQNDDLVLQLKKLSELYEQRVLTEEEYKEAKKKIIDKM